MSPNSKSAGVAPDADLVSKVLSFSISAFVIQAASNLQTQVDEIVIGIFRPVSTVGAYYVARRLSSLPQMLSQPILRGIHSAFIATPCAGRCHSAKRALSDRKPRHSNDMHPAAGRGYRVG